MARPAKSHLLIAPGRMLTNLVVVHLTKHWQNFGKYIGIMVLVQFERGPVQNIEEYILP